MRIVYKTIFLVLMLIFALNYYTFSQKREKATIGTVEQWIKDPSQGQAINLSIGELSEKEINKISSIIRLHSKDSLFDVRWKALSLTSLIGSANHSQKVQSNILSILLCFMFDADSRITHFASQNLTSLSFPSYSSNQKDTLVTLSKTVNSPNLLVGIYKVCGEQYVNEAIPTLEQVAYDPKIPFFQRWVALASLTRLGSVDAEKTMHSYFSRVGLSLDAINTLYPYILFSRSRSNVDYLIDLIKNDNSGCESSNPNTTSTIPCAYLILKVVGPEIKELYWSGPNGLERLGHKEALSKAKEVLMRVEGNWSFTIE